MPLNSGLLSWDIVTIAAALKISVDDVREYFTDGRRISFILERRLASEVLNGVRPKSEAAPYDIEDSGGRKWEVRSISRQGVYFCPSYMVGSGRSFDVAGFIGKLESIEGYIISDIERFPNVPFWVVPSEIVRKWWDHGDLNTNSKISRRKALKLLQSVYPSVSN